MTEMTWVDTAEREPPHDRPLLVASRDGDFWFYALIAFSSRQDCWIDISSGFEAEVFDSHDKSLDELGWPFWKLVEPPRP